MTRLFLAALLALGCVQAALAQGTPRADVVVTQLSPTTYMLVGEGGNLGLSVGADAVFLIDSQFAPMTPQIRAAIARITPKPVQFVLNTHFHFDHTGGNENFARDNALIFAHDNVRTRMSVTQLLGLLGMKQDASPPKALPLVTFATDMSFHINGERVHVFHVPAAHTDGDAIVHFRASDVIHMGDVYFNGFYPFIDGSSGGTADGTIAAIDRVLALAGERTRIIPGHGPLASRADLRAYRDMLATVTERIKTQRKAGRSDAEIKAARPTQDFDAKLGGGFIKPDLFVDMMLGVIPR